MRKLKSFMIFMAEAKDYKELKPGKVAYYDGVVYVDLSTDQANDSNAVPPK